MVGKGQVQLDGWELGPCASLEWGGECSCVNVPIVRRVASDQSASVVFLVPISIGHLPGHGHQPDLVRAEAYMEWPIPAVREPETSHQH